jgi:serine/threonine protein kinase
VVVRKLAEGGMAELLLCSSHGPLGFEKQVVIKRIRESFETDAEFVEMFVAEAKLASQVSHPNLVQIFDFGTQDEKFYLVMEYLRGKSLTQVRQASNQRLLAIPPILVAHIGQQIAKGLHHAHELHQAGRRVGVVHRDVTPHNVLLSFDGSVKLTDFGIAKRIDMPASHTLAGQIKGKFAYMSPEQANGANVDARSDIFSLGIVLWELLTGGRLFSGDSQQAILNAVKQSNIPNPARLNSDVPQDIDTAVMRALSRDRAERFTTAGELARALGQSVLHHAKSVDDHDVAAFLAQLFPEEMAAYRTGAPLPGFSEPVRSLANLKTELTGEWISFKSLLHSEGKESLGKALGKDPGMTADALLPSGSTATTLLVPNGVWGTASEPANRTTVINFSLRPSVVSLERAWSAILARLSPARKALSRPLLIGLAALAVLATSLSVLSIYGSTSRKPDTRASIDQPAVLHPPQLEVRPPVAEEQKVSEEPKTALLKSPKPEPEYGTLVLKVVPWALVSIDGERRGEVSGIRRIRLPAGKHRVKLWHPREGKELWVTIGPGESLVQQHQIQLPVHSSIAPNTVH